MPWEYVRINRKMVSKWLYNDPQHNTQLKLNSERQLYGSQAEIRIHYPFVETYIFSMINSFQLSI